MGLKEEILGLSDSVTQSVKVPEWKRSVLIRSFTGAERDAWEQQHQAATRAGKPVTNFRAKLAALIVVDEAGQRIFSDEDALALGQKNAKALDRIFDAFLKINKLSKEEAEEIEKNS